MKVLVTGATGFLGQALVKALLARGDHVRSLARGTRSNVDLTGIEVQCGNVADAAAVQRAVAGVDMVFHVAAKAGSWGRRIDYEATNVEGTRHVIRACKQHGVRSLIYTSSPSVVTHAGDLRGVDESQPYPAAYLAEYPRTKAMAERMVLAANDDELATVALRPHLIWGPGDTQLYPRIVARARSQRLIQVGKGDNIVDVTYIDDAVQAHLCAANTLQSNEGRARVGGKTYFVSSGTPVPLWQMVGHFLAIEGLSPPRRKIPLWLAIQLGRCLEHVHRLTGRQDEPRITRWVAHELGTSHWFDIGAAQRDLGWQPRTNLAQGLQALAASIGAAKAGANRSPLDSPS